MPVKTTVQQKYVRDYSVMWFSTSSEETNSFTFCRYSSNSLGTDGKFREPIQNPSISSQSPWLCLCSCKEAVTKSSSCLLTHGCLGTMSNFYAPSTSGHMLCTWQAGSAGERSWLDPKTQINQTTPELQEYGGNRCESEML